MTKRPHPTPEQRQAIVDQALAPCRATFQAIADSNGVSIYSLFNWILKHEASPNQQLARKVRTKQALDRYLKHMADNPDHTAHQAAAALGVTLTRIRQMKREVKGL
jgi:transposase-like protein